jgi:hypothetical protein
VVATLRQRWGRRRWPHAATTGSLHHFRAARGRALQLQLIQAYTESHEREGLEHRDSPALWWARARKHADLHTRVQPGCRGRCANTP